MSKYMIRHVLSIFCNIGPEMRELSGSWEIEVLLDTFCFVGVE